MSTQEGNLQTNANGGVPNAGAAFYGYNRGWNAGVTGTRNNAGNLQTNNNYNLWASSVPANAAQAQVIRSDVADPAWTISYQAAVGRVAAMPVRCISYATY